MENERKEVISISGLEKVYNLGRQQVKALDGVSLTICKNEYVAIMGPSGSGKSTLMNILGCLDTPSGGKYVLNGTDVSKMEDGALAETRNREIGFVFQSFNLLPRYSALENVGLPLVYSGISSKERERRATQALEAVGLGDRMEHKPAEMSGGQRQRGAVARALINNPSIILADEPTGNLDTKTSIEIMRLFEDIYKKGNTVIVIEHNLDVIKCADWIIDMGPDGGRGGGQLLFSGTPEDLVKNGTGHTAAFLAEVLKS